MLFHIFLHFGWLSVQSETLWPRRLVFVWGTHLLAGCHLFVNPEGDLVRFWKISLFRPEKLQWCPAAKCSVLLMNPQHYNFFPWFQQQPQFFPDLDQVLWVETFKYNASIFRRADEICWDISAFFWFAVVREQFEDTLNTSTLIQASVFGFFWDGAAVRAPLPCERNYILKLHEEWNLFSHFVVFPSFSSVVAPSLQVCLRLSIWLSQEICF